MQQTPATSLLLLLCLNQNLTCLRSFWGQAILGFKNPCLHWPQNIHMAHCNSARLSNPVTGIAFLQRQGVYEKDGYTNTHTLVHPLQNLRQLCWEVEPQGHKPALQKSQYKKSSSCVKRWVSKNITQSGKNMDIPYTSIQSDCTQLYNGHLSFDSCFLPLCAIL